MCSLNVCELSNTNLNASCVAKSFYLSLVNFVFQLK